MGYLKLFLTTVLVASTVLLIRSEVVCQQENSELPTINELQQKRIGFLKQRVEKLVEFVDAGLADEKSLSEARIDLLKVAVEYEAKPEEKKKILGALLQIFEEAIERAQFRVDMPRRVAGNPVEVAVSDLYWLKAERVRFEIEWSEL